jgi:hypothetical protein
LTEGSGSTVMMVSRGEDNLGAATAHLEGAGMRSGLAGPTATGARAAACSIGAGLAALSRVSNGSATTGEVEDEVGLNKTEAQPWHRCQ